MNACFPVRKKGARARAHAFSLIELLVAVTILVLLMVFVAQLLNNTMTVTRNGGKRMDADTQARTALDRIAFDIAKMTTRADIDYYLQKNTGDDQMAFFSESTGYYPPGVTGKVPKSNVTLVGYRIKNNQMERLGKSLIWNGVTAATSGASGLAAKDRPMVFLPQTIADTWPDIIGNGTDSDYQVIGDQIFRLEFCYLVRNVNHDAYLSGVPYIAGEPLSNPHSATNLDGLSDVVAVVVTLAVLDSKSRLIITNAQLTTAAGKLSDVTSASLTSPPLKTWQDQILADGLGLPGPAGSQVRVYQRYCYLNRNQ